MGNHEWKITKMEYRRAGDFYSMNATEFLLKAGHGEKRMRGNADGYQSLEISAKLTEQDSGSN